MSLITYPSLLCRKLTASPPPVRLSPRFVLAAYEYSPMFRVFSHSSRHPSFRPLDWPSDTTLGTCLWPLLCLALVCFFFAPHMHTTPPFSLLFRVRRSSLLCAPHRHGTGAHLLTVGAVAHYPTTSCITTTTTTTSGANHPSSSSQVHFAWTSTIITSFLLP